MKRVPNWLLLPFLLAVLLLSGCAGANSQGTPTPQACRDPYRINGPDSSKEGASLITVGKTQKRLFAVDERTGESLPIYVKFVLGTASDVDIRTSNLAVGTAKAGDSELKLPLVDTFLSLETHDNEVSTIDSSTGMRQPVVNDDDPENPPASRIQTWLVPGTYFVKIANQNKKGGCAYSFTLSFTAEAKAPTPTITVTPTPSLTPTPSVTPTPTLGPTTTAVPAATGTPQASWDERIEMKERIRISFDGKPAAVFFPPQTGFKVKRTADALEVVESNEPMWVPDYLVKDGAILIPTREMKCKAGKTAKIDIRKDRLMDLAKKHGTTVSKLAEDNKILNPNQLGNFNGQTLKVDCSNIVPDGPILRAPDGDAHWIGVVILPGLPVEEVERKNGFIQIRPKGGWMVTK
jgi:hypothetical protein